MIEAIPSDAAADALVAPSCESPTATTPPPLPADGRPPPPRVEMWIARAPVER